MLFESPEALTGELQKDELLKRDVYSVVEKLTPFLPFIGFLSGGVVTAKHVYNHRGNSTSAASEEIVVERVI